MAVGLPLKTTYANGDVYSAADVNDTNGTINLFQTSTNSYIGGKNSVINGGMDIWQRGTSITYGGGNVYTADRWQVLSGTAGKTITRQVTGDTTNLPNIQYCARVQRTAAQTATDVIYFTQSFETVNSIPLASKIVTLSFYARAGANFSAASSILVSRIDYGTGTDQNVLTGYTGSGTLTQNNTLTTTWKRFTFTTTIPSTATEMGILFSYTPVGTAGAADYYEITGVQLELGSYATTFSRAGGTIQGELAACQRYYWRNTGNSTGFAHGFTYSTTAVQLVIQTPVAMRTAIASVDYSNIQCQEIVGGGLATPTGITLNTATPTSAWLLLTGMTGLTSRYIYTVLAQSTLVGYLAFNAEL